MKHYIIIGGTTDDDKFISTVFISSKPILKLLKSNPLVLVRYFPYKKIARK